MMPLQKMEQSSCTEDRIQHVLERCLCGLGVDTPDKHLWNAGLCVNRWCLEELVKRDPHNFLILLHKILRKTKEVLEECQYEQVVPLMLLFSSTLLRAPHLASDCGVLQEASLLFQRFLSWPEPCCSASKRLLNIIHHELRAPGISFQRLVRKEHSISHDSHHSKTMTVLLVSPDEDIPPEVQLVSKQLSVAQQSDRDVTITLLLHALQAALGGKHHLQGLHEALQAKRPEELQQLLEEVTDCMERAASTADIGTARQDLLQRMEKLRENFAPPTKDCLDVDGERGNERAIEMLTLPFPKCHACSWENDNFDVLNDILDVDSPSDCFVTPEMDEDEIPDISVEEEDEVLVTKADQDVQNHRISTASSSSRDSMFSGLSLSSSWSAGTTPSGSSGVESDFSEDTAHEDTEEGQDSKPKPRRKPKKKSRSLLGERFSMIFKTPRSPSTCRRVQSMGFQGDYSRDPQRWVPVKHSKSQTKIPHPQAALDPLSPQKHMCMRRRPILSSYELDEPEEVVTQVRVVVFGGDREAGRLARAYSDLQQKEAKCRRLTRMCRLQFYFVPTKRRTTGISGGYMAAEGQIGSSNKAPASMDTNGAALEDSTCDIANMLGMMDPWYERNVLSLISLSSDVLCQPAYKEGSVSESSGTTDRLPLLADLVLYYCRHAEQPVLVQLYQAELTLAGGEKRTEVFIHSLELGHTAATRAVRAMGAASKRFGIDEEREAVPLTLSVDYNKVAVSGRSQWIQGEVVCTSINLFKACRKQEQLDSTTDSLLLTMTEVLKRQCSKSKKGYNQHFSISEVKVDRVQVSSADGGPTFAVCLDQDEKKFIQSVTRVEVYLCCKPGSGSDWRSFKPSPGQVQPLHPSYCSLLCLPITSFAA